MMAVVKTNTPGNCTSSDDEATGGGRSCRQMLGFCSFDVEEREKSHFVGVASLGVLNAYPDTYL